MNPDDMPNAEDQPTYSRRTRWQGGGLVRALAWTAGLLSGALALVAVSAFVVNRSGISRTGRDFESLRRRLGGKPKRRVADLLGPPRAATLRDTTYRAPVPAAYWNADVWYYPYDPSRHTSIAIHFAAGRVRSVQVLGR